MSTMRIMINYKVKGYKANVAEFEMLKEYKGISGKNNFKGFSVFIEFSVSVFFSYDSARLRIFYFDCFDGRIT